MHLASKRVLSELKLTPTAFDWLLGEVESRFYFAQVGPMTREATSCCACVRMRAQCARVAQKPRHAPAHPAPALSREVPAGAT